MQGPTAQEIPTIRTAKAAAPPRPVADALQRQAMDYCRKLAKSQYENFLVGTLFVPRAIRQDFYNVYAYCRTADDLADESPSPQAAKSALAKWRCGFEMCVDPKIPLTALPHPVFIALRATIALHRLPQQPFLDLLDAFEQDQTVVEYQTFDQLLDYCNRSAAPVGRTVLRMAGVDDSAMDALSDQICTGLQLANFCQDVQRDRALGRIYIPVEDRQRFSVEEADLDAAQAGEAFKRLLQFEVDRAADYLQQGLPLADRVPRWLSRDVRLFAHGGLETLQAIRRVDYDVLQRRPRVSRWRQATLLGRAVIGRLS